MDTNNNIVYFKKWAVSLVWNVFFQVVFVKADCRSCTNSLETLAKVHKDLHMQGEVQADLLKVVLFIIQLKIKY